VINTVFTLIVFHCSLCHVGLAYTTQKHSAPAPAGFPIPNPASAGFEKIISGATLIQTLNSLRRKQASIIYVHHLEFRRQCLIIKRQIKHEVNNWSC